jgi:hypothetical protein
MDQLPRGTRITFQDPWKRRTRSGVVLSYGRSTKPGSTWNVYLVAPDDGQGQTMALPDGTVHQAVEVHPDRIRR